MRDHSEPNYEISHPKKPKEGKPEFVAEFSAYTEHIRGFENRLVGVVEETEGLLARQKSLQQELRVLSLNEQDKKSAAKIMNALDEIGSNITCLEKMYDDLSDLLAKFRVEDRYFHQVLENFESTVEN